MNTRLNYMGGARQIDRMNKDKLISLKRALLYSYQSATMRLENEDEFRCLINPDKTKLAYDDKILSVPFEDVQLNEEKRNSNPAGICKVNIKPGDTFEWKENHTHWIVYARHYEETAYFRAEIRECRYKIEIGDREYWIYLRGPEETTIQWNERKKAQWNELNYDLLMYITKDNNTIDYFHRFSEIKIDGNNWKVQAVDSISGDGLITICLKEHFNNTIHEEAEKEKEKLEPIPIPIPKDTPYIKGESNVRPYESYDYYIINPGGNGVWIVDNDKIKISNSNIEKCSINITTGKSGNFTLIYRVPNKDDVVLDVKISSLI